MKLLIGLRCFQRGSTGGGGPSAPDFALARYNSDGSLDYGFGSGGKVITDFFGALDRANAVVIQPDGKIVAVGFANAGATALISPWPVTTLPVTLTPPLDRVVSAQLISSAATTRQEPQ
jgi:hypothetical protein